MNNLTLHCRVGVQRRKIARFFERSIAVSTKISREEDHVLHATPSAQWLRKACECRGRGTTGKNVIQASVSLLRRQISCRVDRPMETMESIETMQFLAFNSKLDSMVSIG
jgi:hypothetical protein